MRQRKPLDLFELTDWIAQDMAPLNAAWSVIWARGDQEMVRRPNALPAKCSDLMGVGTATQHGRSYWERLRRFVVGEHWTEDQGADSQKALKEMAHGRKDLAEYARRKLGKRHVELIWHDEPGGAHGP
jgi:hypothetical protein